MNKDQNDTLDPHEEQVSDNSWSKIISKGYKKKYPKLSKDTVDRIRDHIEEKEKYLDLKIFLLHKMHNTYLMYSLLALFRIRWIRMTTDFSKIIRRNIILALAPFFISGSFMIQQFVYVFKEFRDELIKAELNSEQRGIYQLVYSLDLNEEYLSENKKSDTV